MERDICVGTEAVFNVAEELSAEEAHPDIDGGTRIGCGSTCKRTERSSLEPVRWIALDNLNLATEAHFLQKIGDEAADDQAPPTMTTFSLDNEDPVTPD